MLLKNCKLVGEEGLKDILIIDGKIKQIGKDISGADDEKIIEIAGKTVIPGIIDCHVHFREPGMTQKEDFLTGSRAAAAGGITTILDMPNTKPPTITVKDLENKRELAKKSIVNYGFHFGSTKTNIEEIKKAGNIASVKIFFDLSTGKLMIDDDNVLEKIFKTAKTVTAHAEGDMVKKVITLAKKHNTKLYLCHISTKEEIDYIRDNKTENIFVEVTPHHLFLTEEDDKDSFTKMKPELKTKLDQKALLDALNEGLVDTIGTDHAPHTKEEKKLFDFPHGVPGEETILPLLLNAVNKDIIKIEKIIELCCHNPAKIFKIKNKGYIKEGFDADFTIIDIDLIKKVDENTLQTKCKWSPFNDKELKGWPIITIVNGNIVYENGKINDIKAKEVVIS